MERDKSKDDDHIATPQSAPTKARGRPGKSSRSHSRYAGVPAPPVQLRVVRGPVFPPPKPLPNYPDMFGGVLDMPVQLAPSSHEEPKAPVSNTRNDSDEKKVSVKRDKQSDAEVTASQTSHAGRAPGAGASSSQRRYDGVVAPIQRQSTNARVAKPANLMSRADDKALLAFSVLPHVNQEPVQRKADGGAPMADEQVQQIAAQGVQGSGQALPHLERIQEAFGAGHDLSQVKAHVGGEAAVASKAIGAEAYATGDNVAFGQAPDLHTAAHEAAHVVQQRAGVQLKGGVGQVGDVYEQNADAVADAVVRGDSAAGLLAPHGVAPKAAIQLKEATSKPACSPTNEPTASVEAIKKRNKNNNKMVENMKVCVERYRDICGKQKAGVAKVKTATEQKDPPPVSEALLGLACDLALAGAFGALGKIVEIGIASRFGGSETAKAISVIGKGIASSTKATAKKLVYANVKARYGDKDAFWASQSATLATMSIKSRDAFIAYQHILWADPEGPEQAAGLRMSLDNALNEAAAIQSIKTLDEWANMLAQKSLGSNPQGDPYMHNELGDLTNDGVLGLEVSLFYPLSAGTQKARITSATIEGLNAPLRKGLMGRPLKDIHVTKNIVAKVITLTTLDDQGILEFAIHPSGNVVWRHTGTTAGKWLAERGQLPGGGGIGGGTTTMKAIVEQDLKDQTLPNIRDRTPPTIGQGRRR